MWVISFAGQPLIKWLARRGMQRAELPESVVEGVQTEWIEPDATINPLVLAAAASDFERSFVEDPSVSQSKLNAVLESLRGSQRLTKGFAGMYMALSAKGYPIEETNLRLAAKVICLGMALERRLQSANAVNPQPTSDPERSANA